MQYIIPLIKKYTFLLLLTIISFSSTGQSSSTIDNYMKGRWKIVLHDYRGYQKFAPSTAKRIEKSTLIITGNNYYYEDLAAIDTCNFYKWRIIKLDSLNYDDFYGLSLPHRYPLSELKKLLRLEPVQKDGCFTCYNECNLFFLKQDTLINICGGYTFFLIKTERK